jgi:hypothetical protein
LLKKEFLLKLLSFLPVLLFISFFVVTALVYPPIGDFSASDDLTSDSDPDNSFPTNGFTNPDYPDDVNSSPEADSSAFTASSDFHFNLTAKISDSPSDNWTIMIYLDGDNNLEQAAITDINELESIDFSSKAINVIALVDRAAGYDSSNGNWQNTRLYEITHDSDPSIISSNLLASWGEQNMGNGSTLVNFVNYTMSHYPANHTALVFWDHGGGIDGVCWDDASNSDYLSISEIASSIRRAKGLLEDKGFDADIDILGFDACLMASLEVVYEFKDLAKYMVASEEYEPGNGWPYHLIMNDLVAQPTMSPDHLATVIVERYAESYQGINADITQSAIDLASVGSFISKFTSFVTDSQDIFDSEPVGGDFNGTQSLHNSRDHVQNYHSANFVDLYHFVSLVRSSTTDTDLLSSADAILSAWNSLVIAEKHGSRRADSHGLTINFPTDGSSYRQSLRFTSLEWDEFLSDYALAVTDSAYLSWLSGQSEQPITGVDVSCWWEYEYTPEIDQDINITWFVINNGTRASSNVVLMVYESSRYSKEDAVLVGYIEVPAISPNTGFYGFLTWTMNTSGYRTISIYAWCSGDEYESNNYHSDTVWVIPLEASVRGSIWIESTVFMGFSNALNFSIQNLGAGEILPWFGNVSIWAYSYELDNYYLLLNTSFAIDAWLTGSPPELLSSIDWNPSWGGWWDLIIVTTYENDVFQEDDVYLTTIWVIDADCDLETYITNVPDLIEGLSSDITITVFNYGLTAPSANATVLLFGWSYYEASINATYDWQVLGAVSLSMDDYLSVDWYDIVTISWIPTVAGDWLLTAVAYEDLYNTVYYGFDNDYVESNDEDSLQLWVISYNPDIQVFGSIFADTTYQVGLESLVYIEIWNFGWTDSLASDVSLTIWDYDIASDNASIIFNGYNTIDVLAQSYIYGFIDWVPNAPGEHVLIVYAEDIPNEPYSVVDEYNWYYIYVNVEEAPESIGDVDSTIWESSDDYLVTIFATNVGDVDADGILEVVMVGNITELSTSLEFFGLWIFNYNASLDQLVLEYETYWSTGQSETLQDVLIADLDNDLIPEITLIGFYYNTTDSSWYSWLAMCNYYDLSGERYLEVITYKTIADTWILSVELGEVDADGISDLVLVGYYWEWNASASDWVTYGFLSIIYFDTNSQDFILTYETYWLQGDNFYLQSVKVSDLNYPVLDGIDEIVMVGYFYDEGTTTWYAYTAIYEYDYAVTGELILIDYETAADMYIMDVAIQNVDQFAGNEIVVIGYYQNSTGEYILLDIFYYDDAMNDLVEQDIFIIDLEDDEILTTIDVIDVNLDGEADIVVGGYYWDSSNSEWTAFIAVYDYHYGSTSYDGTMTLLYFLAWANSDDILTNIKAINLDTDDDIEVAFCGTADSNGQAGIVTLTNYVQGTVDLDASSYEIGQTITITITDNDLNENSNQIETVDVLANSTTDTVGITITLTETTQDSGVFTGTFTLVSTSSDDVNEELQVENGDIVTVIYNDEQYGEQSTEMIVKEQITVPEFTRIDLLVIFVLLSFAFVINKKSSKTQS